MTVQVKKKFDNLDDGINNMLDAAAWDYNNAGFKHQCYEDFRAKFIYTSGKKYIKVGQISNYDANRMGSVWAFIVKEDDGKFKKGDILKAAGWNAPAKNSPRGNVLDGGFNINWTGALYL